MTEKYIPREKLNKKARKALDSKKRTTWNCNPISKIVESKKLYSRKEKSRSRNDDYGCGIYFLFYCFLFPWLAEF